MQMFFNTKKIVIEEDRNTEHNGGKQSIPECFIVYIWICTYNGLPVFDVRMMYIISKGVTLSNQQRTPLYYQACV